MKEREMPNTKRELPSGQAHNRYSSVALAVVVRVLLLGSHHDLYL